ncbi:LTA synthase family protein [Anthropogastromicrobium aceti]|uniref:LTA synthase family protein n=1 Tax=Anthropogastromicrobium aceti TaxID=2981768 RepID=UPI0008215500|nr:LTA synthase family protein [Anthropogastromicrobium aceti]MCU6784329.1 LTA synthase family protein [Anthropogastromicrobium aceti]SCJ64117.1 Phosphoglycerol transferase and related proteins%2C alkaline phosphatase superfamily [uncultured Lachnospira sp.]
MSFKEKAVSWRQEVHIGKTKPRLIKAAILLLCFGVLIGMAWYYSEFSAKDCAILAGICVLTLAIYMIDMPVHPVIRIIFALVIPLGCFYTFETLTHQMSTMIELAKRLNIAFYYWLFLFVFFIAGRTSISMAICVSAIAIIGVGNYFVVMFRSNPIVPWDIYSFETAMSVADNYVFSVDWALAEHIAMFILMLIVGVRTNIRLNKKILRPILTVAMCIPAYFYISYLWQDNLERNTGLNDTLFNAKYMHSKDGFFVSFILDIHFLQIEEPKNYSDEYALSLLNEQEVEKVETPEELPDIIAIMDETFSDPAVLGEFETNKDYMPFVHSILRGEVANTISGYADVSVLGGNTANSEFEFLTGNSMAFFPNGSVPYLQYIRDGISTIVPQLEEYGYTTYGTHPYRAKGWNREFIYDLMGFDYRYFQGSFPFEDKLRNYVSDEADFKSILEWRNNTEGPFFMFNVTMQNHSNYGGDFDNFDPQIVAKFKNTYSNKYLNKYLSLMYETDQDVASLLSELSQSDRKTIVVFWGDHQPNDYVVRPIYKEYGLDFDNQTYEQQQQRQKTPFFIWANYDIQEQTNVEISLNYLNILLFETAGLQLDEYQTFRKNLWQGQIPMMNAVGYRNDDGDLVEYDDAPEEIQNLLNEYQNIQYYRMEREYSKKK